MGQKSSISRLDPRIIEAVDCAVREDRATIDEIVVFIHDMGGDASRSAVGRYTKARKSANVKMQNYVDAQHLSAVWIRKIDETPGGDVGRLNAELLRTVALQVISRIGDDDAAEPTAGEIALLARGIKDLASADKISADRDLRVRREVAGKVEALEKDVAAGARQLTLEALKRVRQEIYGIGA